MKVAVTSRPLTVTVTLSNGTFRGTSIRINASPPVTVSGRLDSVVMAKSSDCADAAETAASAAPAATARTAREVGATNGARSESRGTAAPPEVRRRDAGRAVERGGEVALVGEAALERDLRHRQLGGVEHGAGAVDPLEDDELVRRGAGAVFERANEMEHVQLRHLRQLAQGDRVVQLRLDELHHPSQRVRRERAARSAVPQHRLGGDLG